MKKINKKNILIFAITMTIAIITYINFWPEYYSIDTTKIIKDGYIQYGIQYSLYDGRIFMFIFLALAGMIGININNLITIFLILGLIISSINVLILYNIIVKHKPAKNKITTILLYLISYCFIFNFMHIDSLEFIEGFVISASILFYMKSAESIVLKEEKFKGLLYCIIGILFYQGAINVFVAAAIMFLIIDKQENKKNIIKKVLMTIGVLLLSIILDFLIVYIIRLNVQTVQIPRLKFEIIKNFIQIKEYSPNLIINSVKLFPKFLHIILVSIIILILFTLRLREKRIIKMLPPIFFVIICYLSSMAIVILTPEMLTSINGRVFIPTGIMISALLIYLYLKTDLLEQKKSEKIIQILIFSYFIINVLNTIYVTGLLKEGNNIDKILSYNIKNVIEEYEEKTNVEIEYIAVAYSFKNQDNKKSLRSRRIMRKYDSLVYKIYTGEALEDIKFESYLKAKYFKNVESGIKCIDNIIYVLL